MNLAAAPQHDPFATSLAGRRLGRYEVLARLASGGMAGVYVARAIGVAGFERVVAIKVLHPHLAHEEEFISMFLDEARLAARIRHPNVVPTTDISDTQDAGFYLVMDYIEGDHLGALLQAAYKTGQRLPAPASLRIVMDALNGLGAAHALTDESGRRINLVHRDVSPHNIMVGTDGISRLTDFGVAKAEVRLSTTREGQFKGKLAYMSPEHASSGETDQRSDLFSMGIILWECLTGRRLFRAENHAATLNLICLEPIPLPSSVDTTLAPFDAILAKALDRDPNKRFQTAEDFADAIEHEAHALGGLSTARTVGKLVRTFAAEKLDKDRDLIQSSIAALSLHAVAADMSPRPMRAHEADAQQADTIADGDMEELFDAPQETARASDPPPAIATTSAPSRAPWIALGLAAFAIVGVAVAYALMGGQSASVTSSSISDEPGPTSEASAPEPLATDPVTPEPAAAAEEPPAAIAHEVDEAQSAADSPGEDEDERIAETGSDEPRRDADGTSTRRRPRITTPGVAAAPAERPVAAPKPDPEPAPREPTPPRKPAPASDDDLFLNPYRR